MILDWLRNAHWIQNLVARILCGVPPEIHHNLGKLAALRNAFALTAAEGVDGDYLEFGVFEGNSLVAAVNAYRTQSITSFHKTQKMPCRFFGFDSFEGFKLNGQIDSPHPTWKQNEMTTSFARVQKRIAPLKKKFQIELVKGFFESTASPENLRALNLSKVRVCLIDCDLKSSTRDAIWHASKYWQPGTVILIDDYFGYKGNPTEGECGALNEFCAQNPGFEFRDYGYYGYNGVLKIVTKVAG